MGDREKASLRLPFNPQIRLELHGATITSDAGLLAFRELDDAQDTSEGGQLVALVTVGVAAIERENISRRMKQGLERAEGKLAGRRWSISRARMHHATHEE